MGPLGLEVGKATRLLERIKASHKCIAAREIAGLLLGGIGQGREILDEHPLITECGRRKPSPVIYIHDAIVNEIASLLRTSYRLPGDRDE
jgi:hypothetical protein